MSMEIVASVLMAGVLLAVWPRRPWQWWAAMALMALTSALAVLRAVSDQFTGEGITLAVVAHVLYGWRDGEMEMARFPWLVAGSAACLMGIAAWCWMCWRLMRGRNGPVLARSRRALRWLALPVGILSMLINPATQDLLLLLQATENAGDELHAELQWRVGPVGGTAKPFVWIYLESMEHAFLEQERLPGVAPNLAELEREHLSFRDIRTAPFMNWTVAGMVASQCGMPFEPTAKQGNGYQAGASCLGDLLADHGYTLAYVGGADLAFSGKGRFYRGHGFSTVLGFDQLKNDSPEHSIWGMYDDTVFARAKSEFLRLKEPGTPFGLVLLTTATHPPAGYPSPACPKRPQFDNPMLAAAHCSDEQVIELVRWLQAHAPDDLLIFVSSDHLQVAGAAHEVLRQAGARENTFIVLGKGKGVVNRPATMVDVAPTVASLLGFDARAIGLGRDLMGKEPTLVEKYGHAALVSMLPGWRVGLRNGQPYELCNRDHTAPPDDAGENHHITQVLCRTPEP